MHDVADGLEQPEVCRLVLFAAPVAVDLYLAGLGVAVGGEFVVCLPDDDIGQLPHVPILVEQVGLNEDQRHDVEAPGELVDESHGVCHGNLAVGSRLKVEEVDVDGANVVVGQELALGLRQSQLPVPVVHGVGWDVRVVA